MRFFLFSFMLLLYACGHRVPADMLFEKQENCGITFENRLYDSESFNIFRYRNFYNGGGVATGDVNNDGLADVFFTANMGSNRLYLNKGDFQFEDISLKAGFKEKKRWSTGVVMVDINQDGYLDIYVCNAGFQQGIDQQNELWINNGDLTFEEKAAEYGLNDDGFSTHAAFFDYDLDGDLDVYILNNSFIPVNTLNYSGKRALRAKDWPVADELKGGGDKLLRNEGGRFVDVSEAAGIYGSLIGFGLGVTVGDVNADHYPDIYISNDFFERDYLYINQRNGTFREELESRIGHVSHSSMGADMADINNDGHPDIFVSEMLPDDDYRLKTTVSFEQVDVQRYKEQAGFYHQYMQNTLQLNAGDGRFREIAHYSGVAASDWSWGALIFDADNDGWNDLFVSNGIYKDVTDQDFVDFFASDVVKGLVGSGKKAAKADIIRKMPSVPLRNKLFRNRGDLRFEDVAAAWGLEDLTFSNGASYADLDNDGDLDLVISNVNQPAIVYKNLTREKRMHHYFSVQLTGRGQNTRAIGSKVTVFSGGKQLMKELIPTRGFQSSVDYTLLFGLGDASSIDSVEVIWPDRKRSLIYPTRVDTLWKVDQQQGIASGVPEAAVDIPLLEERPTQLERHEEDDFVDFYKDRNMPRMLSRIGPGAAVADVNGDGRSDLYIGGSLKKAGSLYVQNGNGFKKMPLIDTNLNGYEDVSALFFDADQDGDADLFLGAGGNHLPAYAPQLQNRLYLNYGKGFFRRSPDSLPRNIGNTTVLVAADFDGDGDQDVFAGSGSVPLNYGEIPESMVYVNNGGGRFSRLPAGRCGGLDTAGMLTGAVWDASARRLTVVGEWMAPRQYIFRNGAFIEERINIANLNGWWQSIASADLDGDGDEDLVLGNLGRNFYLQATEQSPVKWWLGAFSSSGVVEKILTRTIGGRDMPVIVKRELTDQIPELQKEKLRHQEYAQMAIQDLFRADVIANSRVHTFRYMPSVVAWNEGNGRYLVVELPVSVQLSSVNALLLTDVNNDGRTDILAGGNLSGFQPAFSRIDAGEGVVLLNRGNRQWEEPGYRRSGVRIRGEVRRILRMGSGYLFVRNQDIPVFYAPVAR